MRAGAAGGRIAELQRQLAAQQAASESGVSPSSAASAASPPRKLNLTANSLINSATFNPAAQLSPGAKPPPRKSTEDESSTNGDNGSSSSSSSAAGGAMVHAHRAKSKSPRRAPVSSKPAFSANPTQSSGEEGCASASLLATPVKPKFHTEAASPASTAFLSEPLHPSKSPSRSNSYTDDFNMLTSPLDEIGNTPVKDPTSPGNGGILPHSHTPFDAAVQNTPFDKTPFDDSEEIASSSQVSSPFKLNTSTTKTTPAAAGYNSAAASSALAQAAARAKAADEEEKAKLERQKSEEKAAEAAKRSAEIERLRAQVELDKKKAEKARQDALEARQALEQEESLRVERAAAEAEKAAAAERNRVIVEAAKAKEEKEKDDRAKAIAEQHRRNASAASSPRSPERERERDDNDKEDKMAALGMLDFSAPAAAPAATPTVIVTPAAAPAATTVSKPAEVATTKPTATKKHSKAETPESSLLGASTRRKQSVSLSLSASLELSDDDDTDDVLSDDLDLDDGDSLNAAPKKRVQPPPMEATPAKPAAKAAVPPTAAATTTAAPTTAASSNLTVPAAASANSLATPSTGMAGYDPSPSRHGHISASPSSIVPPTFTSSPTATPQRLSNANAADVLSTGDHELDALFAQEHDVEVDFVKEEAEEKERHRLAEQRVREATERVERSLRGEKDSQDSNAAASLSSPTPAAAPEKQLASPLAPSTPSLSVHNSSLNTSTLSGQTVPSPALSVVGSSPSSNIPLAASALAALSPSHPFSSTTHPSTSETNAALQQAAASEPEVPLTEEQRVERDRTLAAQKRAAVKAQLDMMRGIPPQQAAVESSPSQKPASAADAVNGAAAAAPLDLSVSNEGADALAAAAATTAAESQSYMLDLTSPQTANTSITSTTSSHTGRQLSWHEQAAAMARAAIAPPKRKALPPPKTASEGVALVRQKKKEEEARKKAAIEAARALAPHLSTDISTVQEPTKAFKQLQKETSIQLATLDKQAIKAKKDAAYAARFDKESGMFQPTVIQPFSAETMADTKAAVFKRKRKGEPSLGSMNEMQEAQLRNLDFGPPPAEDEVQTGRDLFGIPMPATTKSSSGATKKKKKGVSKAPKFHGDADEEKHNGSGKERPRYMSPKSKSQKDLQKSKSVSSRSQPMSRSASAKSSAANSLANTVTSLKIDVSGALSKKGVSLGFGSSSPSRGGSRSNSTKKTLAGFSPTSSSSLPAHLDESVKRLSAPRSASNSNKKGSTETIHERKSSSSKKAHSRAASSAHDEALVALLSRPTSAAAARTAQTVKVTPAPSSNFAFGARTSTSREAADPKSARLQRQVAKAKTAEGVTIPAPFNISKVKNAKGAPAAGAASARPATASSSSVSSPSAAKRPVTASKIPVSARSNATSTANSAAVSRSSSRKATKPTSNSTVSAAARPKTAGATPSASTDAKTSHIPVKKPVSASSSIVAAKKPASARASLVGKKKESSAATPAASTARPSTAAPVARRPSSGKPSSSSSAAAAATPPAASSSTQGPTAAPPAGAVMKSKKQLQAEAAAAAAASGSQPTASSPTSPAPSVPSSANTSSTIAVGSSGSAFSPVSPTPSPGTGDRPSPMLGSSRGASISIPTSPTPVTKNSIAALGAHHSSQSKDGDLPPIEGPGLLDFFNQSSAVPEEPQPPAVDGNVRVSGSSSQVAQQSPAQSQQPTTAAAIVAAIVRDVNALPAPVSVNTPVSPAAAAAPTPSPAVIVSPPASSPTGSEPVSASPSAVHHDGEEIDEEEAEERRLAEIRKAKLASSKIKLGPIPGEASAGGPNASITPRSSIIKRPSSASIGNANDAPSTSPTASTATLAGAKKTVTMPTSILKNSSSSSSISNTNGSPVSSSAPSVSFVPGTATAPASSSNSFSFSSPASSMPTHNRAPSSHALLRRRFEHERLLVEMAEVFSWLKAIVGEAEMEGAGPVAAAAAKRIEITQPLQPDTLFAAIENGAILCALVSHCQASAHMGRGNAANDALVLNTPPITFKADARVGSFVARDNLSNFLTIMSTWGLSRDRLFEVDDLVLRKNDKQVIQSLLDISRMCFAKFGITPPAIVQMEIEIQQEEEAPPPPPPPMPELPPLPPLPPVNAASNEPPAPKPPRYLPYIPVPGDKLDEAVADLVNGQQIDLCIRRAKAGAYYIGDIQDPKVHFVRLVRHLLLVRVGGGWESFAETAQRKFEAQATEEAKLLQQQQQQQQPHHGE